MLIYLDNCCFNRPFDKQSAIQIRIETEAKLFIQESVVSGKIKLAWSYILEFENAANPFIERQEAISGWEKHTSIYTEETTAIIKLAKRLSTRGLKAKDALHVACAVEMGCNYFITTDKQIVKKCHNFERIKVVNPIDFITILEEN